MDADRFDALARALTAPASRRSTLGGLAAGALLALGLALDETTVLAKKKKKKAKKQRCSAGNPIRCGRFCCRPDETCRDGACLDHCDDGVRNFGETDVDCGGNCVDIPSGAGACSRGQRCDVNTDCFSLICEELEPGAGKICLDCRTDGDCRALIPQKPRCINKVCFECAADGDCPAARPFCVAAAGCPNNEPCACGSCRQDTDCAAGQVCDEQGRCFECFEDAHCTQDPGRPVCVDNVCKQCEADGDCPTAGDMCLLNVCRTPAVCPAGRDLCTQGFVPATACGSGCRCHTTTENETRCGLSLESRCDAQPACTSRAQCQARHGAGAFCVRDTGAFCGCTHCAGQCV